MNFNKHVLTNLFLICFAFSGFSRCRSKINLKIKRDISVSSFPSSYQKFLELVRPIAVKRVSGSPEIVAVRDYISTKMRGYGWHVDFDTFTDNTPFGKKQFSNIIANYQIGKNLLNIDRVANPRTLHETKNRVVFACHYDSKFFREFDFIAATDSAVPCAMLLDIAKFLQENFRKTDFSNLNRHLQFIFFDGEEAFVNWSETDSIYGSRNYAKVLRQRHQSEPFDSIELFILLDLLGGESSSFLNHFPDDTGHVYKILSQIENYLISRKLISRKSPYFFTDAKGNGRFSPIEDDHKPFLKEGVPILHLIPVPFPSQWHTANDNLSNLNEKNIQDLRIIFKYLTMSILNVDPSENDAKIEAIANDEL